MYVKIKSLFLYLIIFIDDYFKYIIHHVLTTSMDSDSISLEAQKALENLRRDSQNLPVIRLTTDLHSYHWTSRLC